MIKTPSVAKSYSIATIREALVLLQENGGNLKRTSVQMNISRDTLRRWSKEYPDLPPEEECIHMSPEARAEATEEIDRAIEDAIKRTRDLIKECKTAVEASTVAKNLVKVKLDLAGENPDNPSRNKHILQQTINILQQQGGE